MGKFLTVVSLFNNTEKHIEQTFQNVLKQTHQDWILIVGDDFSADSEFRTQLKNKIVDLNDPRIIYYDIKFKRELYLFQNFFKEYDYDYHFTPGSDDIIDQNIFKVYNHHFQKYPTVNYILSDFNRVDEDNNLQMLSLVQPPTNYIEDFNLRNKGEFNTIYSKRSGQHLYGVGECMRRPAEDAMYIVKNCRSSNDSMNLFYNLSKGKHLHIPRQLYTYIRREGSISGVLSPEEHKDFNLNANYYIKNLPPSSAIPYNPYKKIWLETSAISSCNWLDKINEFSLITNPNINLNLLKDLYPDKNIVINDFNHKNQVVVWGELNNKLKTSLNLNSSTYCTVFSSDENYSYPPENITEQFKISSSNFRQELNKYLKDYSYYNYFRQCIVTRSTPTLPLQEKNTINITFHNGVKVEILGDKSSQYTIKCFDQKTNKLIYEDTIKNNMWTSPNLKYFVDWKVEVWEYGNKIHEEVLNLKNKRVVIAFKSKSIGDTIAWFPYVEEFRKKHKCQVICSTFHNDWFKSKYPKIEFSKTYSSHSSIYAIYNIGWFYSKNNRIDNDKHPHDFLLHPLQKTSSDILGLNYKEIKPKIKSLPKSLIKEKYVTISIQSTAQCKYWNHPTGWQQVVDFVQSKGYKVAVVDQYREFGVEGFRNISPTADYYFNNSSLDEVMSIIKGAKFHIGIGSGLSWVAWVLNTHSIIISSFSKPYCEFTTNCTRIYNDTPTSGYFNTHKLDPSNWNWYPFKEIKSMEDWYETETITPKQVIQEIQTLL